MLLTNITRYLNVVKLEIGYVSLSTNNNDALWLLCTVDNNIYFKTNQSIKIPNESIKFNLNTNQIWGINKKIITHSDYINVIKQSTTVHIPNKIPDSINSLFNDKQFIKNGLSSINTIMKNKNQLNQTCNIIVMIEEIKIHTSKNNKKHLYIVCNANNIKFNIIKWNVSLAEKKLFENISFCHPIIFSSVLIKYDTNYYFIIQPDTIILFDYIIPIRIHLKCKKSNIYWGNLFSKKHVKFVFTLNNQKIGINYTLLKKHAQKINCSSKWFVFNSKLKLITSPTITVNAFCQVCKYYVTIFENKCEICNSMIEIVHQKLVCNILFEQKLNNHQIHQFKLNVARKQLIQFLLIYKQNVNFPFKTIQNNLINNDIKQLQKKSTQQKLINIIEHVIKTNSQCVFECIMQKSRRMQQKLYNLKYNCNNHHNKKVKKQNTNPLKIQNDMNPKFVANNMPSNANAFSVLMNHNKQLTHEIIKKKQCKKKIIKKLPNIKLENLKIFINLSKVHIKSKNINCLEFQKMINKNKLILFNGTNNTIFQS